jgi:hypothetical protein
VYTPVHAVKTSFAQPGAADECSQRPSGHRPADAIGGVTLSIRETSTPLHL